MLQVTGGSIPEIIIVITLPGSDQLQTIGRQTGGDVRVARQLC